MVNAHGLQLMSPAVLAPDKRVSLSFKVLKPVADFSSLATKVIVASSSNRRLFSLHWKSVFSAVTFVDTFSWIQLHAFSSVQFSSVAQSCPTLCNPMNLSTPGLPVHHQLPEFTQTHVHRVSDAIQPSHPLSFASPPAPNPSQHQSLFQWVNSSHEVAKVLEFQL